MGAFIYSSAEIGLVCAITCCGPEDGAHLLRHSEALGVDPLLLIRSRLGLEDEAIYLNAARWAGLAYSPVIPASARLPAAPADVEDLALAQSMRFLVFDREVLFAAPGFRQFLALAGHARTDPEIQRRICVVPPAELRRALVGRCPGELIDFSRQNLSRKWPFATAGLDLTLSTRFGFVLVLLALVVVAATAPFGARPVLVPLLLLLLILPSWFRLAAIFDQPRLVDRRREILAGDGELPVYSVLVPLRDEAHMVPQLVGALKGFDYPAEKLDVKIIVESDSPATVAAVRRAIGTTGFELLVVPHAAPLTKPKALNFALPLVRGELVVVYDAEDLPEPDQLRRTASRFLIDPELGCIQAELVAENAGENALTALFASEYSGQFGILLPALARWRLPMPLGGTSNHFRTAVLREIGGWDAFNVTEDADLGLRLARRGVRTSTIDSRTFEEAPVTASAWFRQRTRWMKGWMQTFLVHNRQPLILLRDLGLVRFLAVEIYVSGLILTPPLHTLYVLAVVIRTAFFGSEAPVADTWTFIEIFTFVSGYLSAILLSVFGLIRVRQLWLIPFQLLLPLYWALMGLASFKAGFELIRNPHFWSKTAHGLSRFAQSNRRTGGNEADAEVSARQAGALGQ